MITLYKNHGTSIGAWEGWTEGPYVITRSCKKIGGAYVAHQYEAKGKNIGRANETRPEQQALLELESKARLKMDKGYVTSIEAAGLGATNTLNLKMPMLATPVDKVFDPIDWDNAFVQPKLDGHRALYKDGVLYSRQGKVLDIPHIITELQDSPLRDLHLDGELYIHGKPLQELSRLIKKKTEDSLWLEYHIYDTIMDAPFFDRTMTLSDLMVDTWRGSLCMVETWEVPNMDTVFKHHERYRANGYEGTMLRHGKEPYRDGKRSRTLLKIKEFHDAEFEVVGIVRGKPIIRDGMSWEVPVYVLQTPEGNTFNCTAPGDMKQKHELWLEGDINIGRKLTVKFHYYSNGGIPQLPVALRWHETV